MVDTRPRLWVDTPESERLTKEEIAFLQEDVRFDRLQVAFEGQRCAAAVKWGKYKWGFSSEHFVPCFRRPLAGEQLCWVHGGAKRSPGLNRKPKRRPSCLHSHITFIDYECLQIHCDTCDAVWVRIPNTVSDGLDAARI